MSTQQTPTAAASSAEASRFPVWLALVIAACCGSLVALQSRINGELGHRLDDGYTAAAISFGSGLVILLIVLCFWRPGRTGLARVRSELREKTADGLRFWMLLGGIAGALLVVAQGLTAAVLGVALFTVAVVAGQTLSGLVLDRVGLGPGGPRPFTASRLIGSGLALVAVLWAVSAQLGGDMPLWMLVLPFVAGLGTGWQQAVNGRVRAVAQSAQSATLINFIVGSAALCALVLVRNSIVGWPTSLPSEWWLYIGGAIGCIFIAIQAALVRVTGVLLLSLATVSGQLIAALVIDLLTPGLTVAFSTVAGTALALVAVIVASGWLSTLRRARASKI